MPEGPEVRKTVDGLSKTFLNEELSVFEFMSGRYTKKDPLGYEKMVTQLPKLVTFVGCKGKFIYFLFGDGSSLWNTLGMSGYWSHKQGSHPRAMMVTASGTAMFYNDMRNFGTFKFVESQDELDRKLSSLGPDLLSENVSLEQFRQSLMKGKRRARPISQLLMDQGVVSGVGNYLKAEILYDARISPHRLCEDITATELSRLFESSRRIIKLSYTSGGATIRNYKDTNGKNGVYTRRFAVYNQKTDPYGNEVIKEVTKDKRTTHWVPALQK